MSKRWPSAAALVLVPVLALSGCGSTPEDEQKNTPTPAPTGDVEVPEGVTITEPGTELEFGEKAVVAYEPNNQRRTVLELTVDSATKGAIADLSMYTLDENTRKAVPYYVAVTVRNVGTGDVGRTPIPLWGVDATNTLLQASGFTNTFARCPSKPLPASFAPNATTTTCLVYLVPNGGELTAVSFRPQQQFAPIEWKGDIATPQPKPQPKPKPKPKKKG